VWTPALFAAALFGATMFALPVAHAQRWGWSAGSSVGGTVNGGDNAGPLLPMPEEMLGEATQTDMFLRTAVGAEVFLGTRRSNHQLVYNFANYLHFGESESLSFNNDFIWTGTIAPGRFSDFNFAAGVAQGRTGDLALFRGTPQGESVARPQGSISFVGMRVGEDFSWRPDAFWVLSQYGNADVFLPYGSDEKQARTLAADTHLGISRRWDQDGFGLRGGIGHGRSGASVFQGIDIPPRRANYADVVLAYDHAFNDDWAMQLNLGLLGVRVPQIRDPFLDVTALAGIDHRTDTGGNISVQASRGVSANVFVGDVLVQTGGSVRATQFFGRNEAWQLIGSVDFQSAKSVFVVDENLGGIKVFSAALALNYEWSRNILVDFESNYTYQDAEASRRFTVFLPPYTLHRLMVMLSVAYVFPQPEKFSGGGGGRRAPRRISGRAGDTDVSTGLEGSPSAAMDSEGNSSGAEAAGGQRRMSRENQSDRPDIGRGPIDEPVQFPNADPSR
jgi:hypothetical protein